MRDFLRHSAVVFGGIVAANGLIYAYYALVQRAIGVDAAGLFMALVGAVMLLSVPGNVAGTVITKLAADAHARGEKGLARTLGVAMSLAVVPVGIVALLGVTLGGPALQAYFHVTDPVVIGLAAAAVTFTFPLFPQRAVLQGAGNFGGYALSSVVEGFGKGATGVLVFRFGGGIRLALAGFCVSALIAFALNALLATRGEDALAGLRLSRRSALRHVVGIALPSAAVTAMTFADVVLVRHFLSPTAAGLYGVAALVGRAILTLTLFAPTVLFPKVIAVAANPRASRRILLAATVAILAIIGPTLAFLAAAPNVVTRVVAGPSFADAAPLLLPYGVAMAALAAASVLGSYLNGLGRIGFAIPFAVVACLEIGAIALFHGDVFTVIHIVVIGHGAALACCLVDTLLSLRRTAMPAAASIAS